MFCSVQIPLLYIIGESERNLSMLLFTWPRLMAWHGISWLMCLRVFSSVLFVPYNGMALWHGTALLPLLQPLLLQLYLWQ